jgi:predicted nucleotidyltransferase
MDTREAISQARQFTEQVLKEFAPKEVILYGSYAKGSQKELSDIDVAVVFDELKGNRLEKSERLWEIAWNMDGYIEPILLDLLDDRSGFLSEVKTHGIVLYPA